MSNDNLKAVQFCLNIREVLKSNLAMEKVVDANKFEKFLDEKAADHNLNIPRSFEALDKLSQHGFTRSQKKGALLRKCCFDVCKTFNVKDVLLKIYDPSLGLRDGMNLSQYAKCRVRINSLEFDVLAVNDFVEKVFGRGKDFISFIEKKDCKTEVRVIKHKNRHVKEHTWKEIVNDGGMSGVGVVLRIDFRSGCLLPEVCKFDKQKFFNLSEAEWYRGNRRFHIKNGIEVKNGILYRVVFPLVKQPISQ